MTATAAAADGYSLRRPLAASVVLHAIVIAGFLVLRPGTHAPQAPTFRVNLVAAAPGLRQVGVVQPTPPVAQAPRQAQAPLAREVPEPARMKAPARGSALPVRKVATPNAAPASAVPAAAPVAGGGPTGGKGADVANVRVDGPAFPYQGYLDNIVRQIAVEFKPAARGALSAEVAFLIRRDGSVAGVRLTRRSSVYSFDQDALAAIELASRKFGPLPQGFSDDVLPVIFSFDPRIIR